MRTGLTKQEKTTDIWFDEKDPLIPVSYTHLFVAGELVATSPETNADGTTYFTCDIPIRGEQYGSSTHKDATTDSGKYIVKEIRAPLGYYVNEDPMKVTFTYDGQAAQVLESTCTDKPTEMWVSKRDLTNDKELPGATPVSYTHLDVYKRQGQRFERRRRCPMREFCGGRSL